VQEFADVAKVADVKKLLIFPPFFYDPLSSTTNNNNNKMTNHKPAQEEVIYAFGFCWAFRDLISFTMEIEVWMALSSSQVYHPPWFIHSRPPFFAGF